MLGKRVWAWPLPLSSDWQLEGLGDGIVFETCDGSADTEWPPYEFCSSDDSDGGGDHGEGRALMGQHSKSQEDLRGRSRRGSEGYLLPSVLPWHRVQSEPLLH